MDGFFDNPVNYFIASNKDRFFGCYFNKPRYFDKFFYNFFNLINLRDFMLNCNNLFLHDRNLNEFFRDCLSNYRFFFEDFNLFDLFSNVGNLFFNFLYSFMNNRFFLYLDNFLNSGHFLYHFNYFFNIFVNLFNFFYISFNNNNFFNDFVTWNRNFVRNNDSFFNFN